MLKNKLMLLLLAGMVSLSSCGLFHKGCNCPKFGVRISKFTDVQMCEWEKDVQMEKRCADVRICRCTDEYLLILPSICTLS